MEPQLYLGTLAVVASRPMERLMAEVRRIALGDAGVLITGENGVGKGLIARAIHHYSLRRAGPWLEVHCPSRPALISGDELFELARGGALFLDGLDALDRKLQAALGRSLARPPAREVRLMAASETSESLDRSLSTRIAQECLHVPPLRERPEDIVPLAEFFLGQSNPDARLAPDARRALMAYDWPGNIRELREVIRTAALVSPGRPVRAPDLLLGVAA